MHIMYMRTTMYETIHHLLALLISAHHLVFGTYGNWKPDCNMKRCLPLLVGGASAMKYSYSFLRIGHELCPEIRFRSHKPFVLDPSLQAPVS